MASPFSGEVSDLYILLVSEEMLLIYLLFSFFFFNLYKLLKSFFNHLYIKFNLIFFFNNKLKKIR